MSALSNDPAGSIPVDQAAGWTENWRDFLKSSGQAFNKTSFLIPIECIKNILLYNENADGVRAYIALEKTGDVNSATLVLVPVVDNRDIVNQPEDVTKSNVYDHIGACPPVCPDSSPLSE